MSDDLLQQMTRALGEQYDGNTAVPEATRARVIRTLGERRPRRRKWLAVGIPAFVLFGGSTAWAAATGQLDQIVEKAIAVISWESQEEHAVTTARKSKRSGAANKASIHTPPTIPSPSEETDEVETERVKEEVDPPPARARGPERTTPQAVENARPSSQKPVASEQLLNERSSLKQQPKGSRGPFAQASADESDVGNPPVPQEDHTALLTFKEAHRAQFSEGNCARAIMGYDRYLRLDPQGSFALEARYNRGVCLVRVGRHEEARSALAPFAQGKFGDYRRSQSAQILEALNAAP